MSYLQREFKSGTFKILTEVKPADFSVALAIIALILVNILGIF
jgi:hypothetical protein